MRGAKHVVGSQSSLQPCNPYILCLHTEGLCHESFGQLRKIEHLNVLERRYHTKKLRPFPPSLPLGRHVSVPAGSSAFCCPVCLHRASTVRCVPRLEAGLGPQAQWVPAPMNSCRKSRFKFPLPGLSRKSDQALTTIRLRL